MMYHRKHLYPPNWKEIATSCKEAAGWRCQQCHIRHGATRKSKRTGEPYHVWLHAAHMKLHDTHNPRPELKCLCPRCHGRYDFRLRTREAQQALECLKHTIVLHRRGVAPAQCNSHLRYSEKLSCEKEEKACSETIVKLPQHAPAS